MSDKMTPENVLEIAAPAVFIAVAVGKALVAKGLLSKAEVIAQLNKVGASDNKEIDAALKDAKAAVLGWPD